MTEHRHIDSADLIIPTPKSLRPTVLGGERKEPTPTPGSEIASKPGGDLVAGTHASGISGGEIASKAEVDPAPGTPGSKTTFKPEVDLAPGTPGTPGTVALGNRGSVSQTPETFESSGSVNSGSETSGGENWGGETSGGEAVATFESFGSGTSGNENSGGKTFGGETFGGETFGGETSGGETSGGKTSGGEEDQGAMNQKDEESDARGDAGEGLGERVGDGVGFAADEVREVGERSGGEGERKDGDIKECELEDFMKKKEKKKVGVGENGVRHGVMGNEREKGSEDREGEAKVGDEVGGEVKVKVKVKNVGGIRNVAGDGNGSESVGGNVEGNMGGMRDAVGDGEVVGEVGGKVGGKVVGEGMGKKAIHVKVTEMQMTGQGGQVGEVSKEMEMIEEEQVKDRPTHIVAFGNQKGGVTKTSTVVNLAAALSERGRRYWYLIWM